MISRALVVQISPIIFLLTGLSCQKRVHEVNPNFIGEWRSEQDYVKATFKISAASKGYMHRRMGSGSSESRGKVRISGDLLKLGIEGFDILSHPTKIDYTAGQDSVWFANGLARWKMKLRSRSPFHSDVTWFFYRE